MLNRHHIGQVFYAVNKTSGQIFHGELISYTMEETGSNSQVVSLTMTDQNIAGLSRTLDLEHWFICQYSGDALDIVESVFQRIAGEYAKISLESKI